MPPHEIQLLITAKNEADDALRRLRTEVNRTGRAIDETWQRTNRSSVRFARSMAAEFRRAAAAATKWAGAIAAVGTAFAARGFIQAGIQLETMRNGLTAVIGSSEEAAKRLAELQRIAQLPGIQLEGAIDAEINLRAVGVQGQLITRILREVGNALAIVGRPGELSGVVLGMTQMASAGKVLQEEINQISSRIPQFRQAMIGAFGTARSEDIQALGISVEEFLSRTISQLETLDRATGGAQNAISNFQNALFEFNSAAGQIILPAFTEVVNEMTAALNLLKPAIGRLADIQEGETPLQRAERRLFEAQERRSFLRSDTTFDPLRRFRLEELDQQIRALQQQVNQLRPALPTARFPDFPERASMFAFPGTGDIGQRLAQQRADAVAADIRTARRRAAFMGGPEFFPVGPSQDNISIPEGISGVGPLDLEAARELNAALIAADEATRNFTRNMRNTFINAFAEIGSMTDSFVGDFVATIANMILQIQSIRMQQQQTNALNAQAGLAAVSSGDPYLAIGAIAVTSIFSIIQSQQARNQQRDTQRRPRFSHANR